MFLIVGDFDCMDRSDEKGNKNTVFCPYTPGDIECEECLCMRHQWSCGDGQCIFGFNRLSYRRNEQEFCINMREYNYICEMHPKDKLWTQPNGLCWDLEEYDDPLDMNNEDLDNSLKCIYLIRCVLSVGFERDCPCNSYRNGSSVMNTVCKTGHKYKYPEYGLLRPYILFFYDWERLLISFEPDEILFNGSIKCRGFHGKLNTNVSFHKSEWYKLDSFPAIDFLFCNHEETIHDNQSHMQYHDSCWNKSRTFNNQSYAFIDICKVTQECISQYRINDGFPDCREDENLPSIDKNYCSNLQQHRFQCSSEQITCLPVITLGDSWNDCENRHDEFIYELNVPITRIECNHRNDDGCSSLRKYIMNGMHINITNNSLVDPSEHVGFPFESYCNTFWNLPLHFDELLTNCQEWECRYDQYQCQTGQCIPVDWLCDKEWDCPDASDEQAAHLNFKRLYHNMYLVDYKEILEKCLGYYDWKQSLGNKCNVTEEFPCFLADVTNPLDIDINRPCTNLTQIGDGIKHCYGGLDEKNTLESCDGSMLGFSYRCSNQQCLNYDSLCDQKSSSSCKDDILCHHKRHNGSCSGKMDVTCLDNSCEENARCNSDHDCDYGEDEYWCPLLEAIGNEKYKYRNQKENQKIYHKLLWPKFPSFDRLTSAELSDENSLNNANLTLSITNGTRTSTGSSRSYVCNRGVAIAYKEGNITVCLCSPSYYGRWCQYFSNRLTVITHLNLITLPQYMNLNQTRWFKIIASLSCFTQTIDFHEFQVHSDVELDDYVKHKFYLLYSLSNEMKEQKKLRYFNRTDIINNHPYSVQFVIYELINDQILELGSWLYPIYFDFLPSFRLALVLKFPSWFGNISIDPCLNNVTSCPPNSICRPIFTQEYPRFWCSCQNGFYGENCENFDQKCSSYCSPNALCKPKGRGELTNTSNPLCICPLHYFGPRCYLHNDKCNSQPCLNNGTCHSRYDPSDQQSFICHCKENFHGNYCEKSKFAIQINLNIVEHAMASVIQLHDVHRQNLHLLLEYQRVINDIPTTTIQFHHDKTVAPPLAILKLYDHSKNVKYYIVYIQENEINININSTPKHCPFSMSLPFLQSKFFNRF